MRGEVANPLCLQPAGMESWLCSDTGGHFRGATLSFDRSAVASSTFEHFELEKLTVPRMMFSNDRLWRFAQDLELECRNPGQFTPLYRENLVVLMLIELVRADVGRRQTGKLTPAQLKRVLECIEHSPIDRLRLAELAALVGFSPSHFVQAFRRSTGMPPYRWQLSSRVRKAQALMLGGKLSVAEVALATGFVDQSHFTRTFRRFTGCTPSAWLRTKAR